MAFMVECVYGGMSRKQAMGRKLQQQWNEYRRSAADVSAAMMTTTTGRGGELQRRCRPEEVALLAETLQEKCRGGEMGMSFSFLHF